jgi:hypothetical protein
MANISATMLNSIGERGSPCQRPLCVEKKGHMSSLTLTPTWPPETIFWIHAHHFGEKPLMRMACWRKFHFTLSYAFSKSNLRIIPSRFFLYNSYVNSCNMITPSRIFQPDINTVWEGLIIRSATTHILFVRTLVIILKLTFNK